MYLSEKFHTEYGPVEIVHNTDYGEFTIMTRGTNVFGKGKSREAAQDDFINCIQGYIEGKERRKDDRRTR